jgi:hypothetical protein
MHALAHWLGLDNLSGPWYGFWSGFGSDLGILATPLVLLRKHNCHHHGCWRIGRHRIEGTEHLVCRRHHPEDRPGPS